MNLDRELLDYELNVCRTTTFCYDDILHIESFIGRIATENELIQLYKTRMSGVMMLRLLYELKDVSIGCECIYFESEAGRKYITKKCDYCKSQDVKYYVVYGGKRMSIDSLIDYKTKEELLNIQNKSFES